MIGEPVSGGENFPSGPPELADRIWRRYAVAPGMIQTKPMLQRAEQIFQWSLDRAPLSAHIQRRWLPGDVAAYSSKWPELPFARFSAYRESSIGRSPEYVTPLRRKTDSSQYDALVSHSRQAGQSFEHAASEPPVVRWTRPADLLVSRSATIPSVTSVSSGNSETRGLQHRSETLPGRPDTPLQRKSMEPGYADAKMSLPPKPSNEKSNLSPMSTPAKNEDLGVHLLQRHSGKAIRQTVSQSIMRPSIMPLSSQQSMRRLHDPGDGAAAMKAFSKLPVSFAAQPMEAVIQRTAVPITGYQAARRESPLPLVRPLLGVSEGSGAGTLMQAQVLDREQRNLPSQTPLIQRQTLEVPTSGHPVDSTIPALTTPNPVEHSRVPEVDIDKLVEQIIRIISNRMAVERERRGI